MRINSVPVASFAIALLCACAVMLSMWLYGVGAVDILLSGSVIFIVVMAVSAFIINLYVNSKIKPLYRLILSKNPVTALTRSRRLSKSAEIDSFEKEFRSWAESNKKEIERLKENERYRKEYIGNVSHELKTPIFNIQGYIFTLLDGAIDDPAINRRYLGRAEKSINRLINIVTDLDEITKLESGSLTLKKEVFDVVSLARECAEAMEMKASDKNITISVARVPLASAGVIMVQADRHYISQVFINLITNSVRYGNHNGKTVISFIDLFDKVMVEVTDNGVGISPDDIPRLFERFYRTDKGRSREDGGTGLGLSIVKHIMEAHDETVSVRSEPGKGSTFSITLTKNK